MRAIILYIFLSLALFFGSVGAVFADVDIEVNYWWVWANNVNIWGGPSDASGTAKNNDKLQDFNDEGFVDIAVGGEKWLYNSFVQFARDFKNIFYAIATVYFLIISIKLIISSNSEEEWANWKKGVIWITIGIIFMQMAYSITLLLFDQGVSGNLAVDLMKSVVMPLVLLLQTLVGPVFIVIAIYEFYRLVTSNGNEEARKQTISSIIYALIGFIVVKFATILVETFYWKVSCENIDLGILSLEWQACINEADLSSWASVILEIIKWLNSFAAIFVMVMIIYAGFQIIFSRGDEEKVNKGKKAIVYIAIGLLLLVMNFLIVTFFFRPEVAI